MGQYDAFIYVGGAVIVGYFVLTNQNLFANLFPQPQPQPEPDPGGNGGGGNGGGGNGGGGGGGSSGGYDCKKACSNCWCKSYNDNNCSGGCSGCSGGNRTAKCGGIGGGGGGSSGGGSSGGGSSGGGSTGTPTSSKSSDCKKFCNNSWCDSYRKRGCSGGCNACQKGSISHSGGGGCPDKVYNSNCAGNCNQTCWRSRTGASGGQISQVCVSKSNACSAARSAFLKKYAGVARIYATYPFKQLNISNAYS